MLTGSEETFPDATATADAEGTVADYEFTVPDPLADGSYTLTLTEDKAEGHLVEFVFGIGDAPGPDPSPSDSQGADGGVDGGSTGARTAVPPAARATPAATAVARAVRWPRPAAAR